MILGNFSYILVILSVTLCLIVFNNLKPLKRLKKLLYKILSYIGVLSSGWHKNNSINSQIKGKKTFAKSFLYKLIKQMLFDLRLGDVTVEGYLICISILSLICSFFLAKFLKSFVMGVFGFMAIDVFIIALTYTASASGHYHREIAIMDAEDLIIASLNKGFTGAVEISIDYFDDSVKYLFQEYLNNVQLYKKNTLTSVSILAEGLGEEFEKFADKIVSYIKIGSEDVIETFQDDLLRNSQRRTQMFIIQQQINEATLTYLICLLISVFSAYTLLSSTPEAVDLILYSTIGHLIDIIIVVAVVAGFVMLQFFRKVKH